MRRLPTIILLFFLVCGSLWAEPEQGSLKIELKDTLNHTVLRDVPCKLQIQALTHQGIVDPSFEDEVELSAGHPLATERGNYQQTVRVKLDHGQFEGELRLRASGKLVATAGSMKADTEVRVLPGWVSLLPPLLAIVLALTVRQVLLALLAGIWLGGALLSGGVFSGYQRLLDTFLVGSLADKSHAFILLFTMTLGGLVALVSRSGGMLGMVDFISRYARGPRSSQAATWFMGVAIFFDDYANTLLVGNTMRPLTDKFKVSREKLAYLVDSTAAPISSVAIISTWIGYEMSLISGSFEALGIDKNVYQVFLESIVYRYYATFTLAFVLAVAWLGRDFGPMLTAERRAALEGKLLRDGATPLADPEGEHELPESSSRNPWNAIVPIGFVLFATLAGLAYTGMEELAWKFPAALEGGMAQRLGIVIGKSDSYKALLWAATAGGLLSAVMILAQKLMTLQETLDVYLKGVLHMASACIVLVLAWCIGDVCEHLFTGGYLVEITRDSLSARMLPLVTFILSAGVAFSTGTSWATMAIVMPIAIRLAQELTLIDGFTGELGWSLMVGSIAGVLAGATFGDHCSPISDTTIMSSMASACDHIDHVRTQIPYALTTAAIACAVGAIPGGWGVNPWMLNLVGIALCFAVVYVIGKNPRTDSIVNSETKKDEI